MSQFGQISVPAAPTTALIVPANTNRTGLMLKSKLTNTDTIFFAPSFAGTAQTAFMMPLEPGEAVFFGSDYLNKFPAAFFCSGNSGTQDLRFIEF